jgi:hypothetical protein
LRLWIVDHLPSITVGLLALWLPPVVVSLAVDLGVMAGDGYPRLSDPALALPALELALMIVAVPRLAGRAATGWILLAGSRVAVLLQTAWTIVLSSRLIGVRTTLTSRPVVEAVAGLVVAAYLLTAIRREYTR